MALDLELIQPDIDRLNNTIRHDLSSNIPLINTIADYIILSGGKRLRPLITLICGNLLEVDNKPLLAEMAAMIEYIHTATLLHDDVVDESGLRRGRKTANAVFGNAASVLVGDFIYTRAFQMMVRSNSIRLLQIMSEITNVISEGEVLQLLNIGDANMTKEAYYKVIESKTAKLFEAGAKVASILANASMDVENSITEYTVKLGIAFQIADDVLDYVGDVSEMGKNIGDDLAEGKVTLPVIYALNLVDATKKAQLIEAINNPQEADIAKIIAIIQASGGVELAMQAAHEVSSEAIDALARFDDNNPYKQLLVELAHYSVSRLK